MLPLPDGPTARNPRRALRTLLATAVALGAVIAPAAATAAPYAAGPTSLVSGASPFAGCTLDADQAGQVFPGSEVEVWVAVDPTDARNVVAAWQQDRWSNGAARGIVVGVSHDGGATWAKHAPPLTECAGGPWDRASDPWVAFASNGDLYLNALVVNRFESSGNQRHAIVVLKSTDAGDTFGPPQSVIEEDTINPAERFPVNDKNTLTTDPTNPNRVYVTWDRLHFATGNGPTFIARSTDGGQTWNRARRIWKPPFGEQSIGNQIVVLPSGDLVNAFAWLHLDGSAHIAVQRSTDHGLNWTDPIIVDGQEPPVYNAVDPEDGHPVRVGTFLPEVAVDRMTGRLYVVWADGRFVPGGFASVVLSSSNDGGLSWTEPVKVNRTPTRIDPANQQAFTPNVVVTDDGTVGVSYYDFRANTADEPLWTDHWLAHCHRLCGQTAGRWRETHLGETFDHRQAPLGGTGAGPGYFLGEYVGLTTAGSTFLALWAEAESRAAGNPSDLFFAPVAPAP